MPNLRDETSDMRTECIRQTNRPMPDRLFRVYEQKNYKRLPSRDLSAAAAKTWAIRDTSTYPLNAQTQLGQDQEGNASQPGIGLAAYRSLAQPSTNKKSPRCGSIEGVLKAVVMAAV